MPVLVLLARARIRSPTQGSIDKLENSLGQDNGPDDP
jgi:hypothetical protein